MNTPLLSQIIQETKALSFDEQLILLQRLAQNVQIYQSKPNRRRKWSEIRGMATYPMFGEDAQVWVSRSRQDDDNARQAQWS